MATKSLIGKDDFRKTALSPGGVRRRPDGGFDATSINFDVRGWRSPKRDESAKTKRVLRHNRPVLEP
jgi:hypothetical protein